MTIEERRLSEFVRAALLSFGPVREVRALPLSAGGANRVFTARAGRQRVVVKLRADRNDDAAREAWALRTAPRDVAPLLLGHTTPRVLVAAASARASFTRAALLDAPVGGVLVLSAVSGSQPRAPVDATGWQRIARVLRRLHAVRARGPALHVGASAGSAARLAFDKLDALVRWGAIDRSAGRELSRLLRRAEDDARRAPRTSAPRLCHGDLRLHNIVDDGASAWLLDFEHAGVGDPIADLLLFAVRTPLHRHDEQLLWEALLDPAVDDSAPRSRTDLESYFRQRPLFVLLSALAAMTDVVGVARGVRPVVAGARAYVAARFEGARAELSEALGRPARVRRPRAVKPPRAKRWRGVIAVDGTASSGKSIVAAGLADALGARHLNTGLLFRAAAFLALERGLTPSAAHAVTLARVLSKARMELVDRDCVRVEGRALDEVLATIEVERVVARWAAHAPVREALWRKVAGALAGGAIVEGRAIGARFPNARAALFVDAELGVRAERLRERLGRPLSSADARALLRVRDALDARRAQEPNTIVPGAARLDTTQGREADSIAQALRLVRARVRGR